MSSPAHNADQSEAQKAADIMSAIADVPPPAQAPSEVEAVSDEGTLAPTSANVSDCVRFRADISVPAHDVRVVELRILWDRIKDVMKGVRFVQGDLRLHLMGLYGAGPGTVRHITDDMLRKPARRKTSKRGRPASPRFGHIVTTTGTLSFDSFRDLAHMLDMQPTNLTTAYRNACARRGIDGDDHDGIQFQLRGCPVTVFCK